MSFDCGSVLPLWIDNRKLTILMAHPICALKRRQHEAHPFSVGRS